MPYEYVRRIREGTAVLDVVVAALAGRDTQRLDDYAAYVALWDEGVTYYLGVLDDVARARAFADVAWHFVERRDYAKAFEAAWQARAVEHELAGRAEYWGGFVTATGLALVEWLHERGETVRDGRLRQIAATAHRNPVARRPRRRRG